MKSCVIGIALVLLLAPTFEPTPQGTTNPAPGQFNTPHSIAADAKGNVYGAEVGPKAVKKYVKKAT